MEEEEEEKRDLKSLSEKIETKTNYFLFFMWPRKKVSYVVVSRGEFRLTDTSANAERKTHRGFLESAHAFWCTIFFCDHLNALTHHQLPTHSHSAWKLHPSASMQASISLLQLIVTQRIQHIQVVTRILRAGTL